MQYDTVIIGAGVMGVATAYYLSKKDNDILLVEQFDVENDLNSSQDYSRAFRYSYGDDEYYPNLVAKSYDLWKDLEDDADSNIYSQTDALLLAEGKDDHAMKSYSTLKKMGHDVDLLQDVQKRFPQFSAPKAVLDQRCGVINASEAVDSFLTVAKQNSVELSTNTKVTDINKDSIVLDGKDKVVFDNLVVTAGAWVSKLVDVPVTPTKQQLVYFEPEDKERFRKENFPIFAYLDKGFYGFPMYGIDAVKISNHYPGNTVDPDKADRDVSDAFIQDCRAFLKEFIPDLASADVIKEKVCMYSMTEDEDFIVDNVTSDIIVGAGFSGHGFKFAPLIGKSLAELTMNNETQYDISRFKLDRF